MKIAVTYENGQVFQHFGHSEAFKLYEVEDGKVVSAEVVNTEGQGHGALAAFLAQQNVQAVICGGIGEGAQQALAEAGIEVCSGAQGEADGAVEAFLSGSLRSAGTNCNHHDQSHGGCSSHCGGGCPGCGGGGMQGRNVGQVCKVHYRGTLNDGTQFDSSYDRGEPLEFICGGGMMIKGFDAAVANMEIGDEVDVHLTPDEAYGYADPRAVFPMEIANLPGAEELKVGDQVVLYTELGQPVPVKVVAKDEVNVTFDANHELAGKELNFHIELVDVDIPE